MFVSGQGALRSSLPNGKEYGCYFMSAFQISCKASLAALVPRTWNDVGKAIPANASTPHRCPLPSETSGHLGHCGTALMDKGDQKWATGTLCPRVEASSPG